MANVVPANRCFVHIRCMGGVIPKRQKMFPIGLAGVVTSNSSDFSSKVDWCTKSDVFIPVSVVV